MDRGFGTAGWLAVGAVVGWVAGRWTGGYPGGYAHGGYPGGYPGGGCGDGGAWARERNYEQFQYNREFERRLAHVEAVNAGQTVGIIKDEKIAALKDEIVEGKIFRANCRKVDGQLFLPPSQLGNGYFPETRVLESRPIIREREERRCDQGDWFGSCGNY